MRRRAQPIGSLAISEGGGMFLVEAWLSGEMLNLQLTICPFPF